MYEFLLSLRRLFRRRAQNGLMLLTFTLAITLSLLSWSLFHTVFLSQPDFDPDGDYLLLHTEGAPLAGPRHFNRVELEAIKESQTVFEDYGEFSIYIPAFVDLPNGTERMLSANLSTDVVSILKVKPQLGRLFTPEEDKAESGPVVLISDGVWEKHYGRDPNVIGQTIQVSGYPIPIIGVMPPEFKFPYDQDLWFSFGSGWEYSRGGALVKLKPGITRERAERDILQIIERIDPGETWFVDEGWVPDLSPIRITFLLPEIQVSAKILFFLSLVLLLVGCANSANLMLIDFLGRRAEIAAAMAIGIPRAALIRSVVLQVLVISGVAALIGIGLVMLTGPLFFDRIKMINNPSWFTYTFGWHFVIMGLLLALLIALITAMGPILYLLFMNPDREIREHSYASKASGRSLWRRALLTSQIALLTVLVICSGLLVQSSYNVGKSQWGYSAEKVFVGKMSTESIQFPEEDRQHRTEPLKLYKRALAEVKQRPENLAASFGSNPPGFSLASSAKYALDPGDLTSGHPMGGAYSSTVTPDFFKTLEVPIIAGETFSETYSLDGPTPAVINASLAARLWPGKDPLNRVFYVHYWYMDQEDTPDVHRVIGVVRDFQASGPVAESNDAIYRGYHPVIGIYAWPHLYVRDRGGLPTSESITRAIHKVDSRMAFYFPTSIADTIHLMMSSIRMTTDLTTLYAIGAFLLGAIGVYSLTVTQVLHSSREFGIRMALGGQPKHLWMRFVRGHLVDTLVGLVIGILVTSQLARYFQELLHDVPATHMGTYAGASVLILIVATLAGIPSLWRLRRIDPAECLRSY